MKVCCPTCGNYYDTSIKKNENGKFESTCPLCRKSFEPSEFNTTKRFKMMFVLDIDHEYFTDRFEDKNLVVSYYDFDDYHKFLEKLEAKIKHPDSMWYFCFDNDKCICCGACDPMDYDNLKEYFKNNP